VSTLVALDSEHFLCQLFSDEDSNTENCLEVYLFQVDVANMQCTLMDKHEFDDSIDQIRVDPTDPRKFIFFHRDKDYENYIRKGRLTDTEKLEFEDEKLDFNFQIPNREVYLFGDSYKYSGKACLNNISH
jgi:hypothetical protein